MTRRIFLKITLTAVALLILTGLGAEYLVNNITAENLRAELERSLVQRTRLAQAAFEATPRERWQAIVSDLSQRAKARVTVIAADGRVLADSDAEPDLMENHGGRPEFVEALSGGEGFATRRSDTIGVNLLYFALPLEEGAVRLALPESDVNARVRDVRRQVLQMLFVALFPAMLISAWLARRISAQLSEILSFSRQLARGDFQSDLRTSGGGEFGELGRTLREARGQLRSMFEQLQDERSRFAAAVNGIGEGILVADKRLHIVLYNPAMGRMLSGVNLHKGASLNEWERREVPELFSQVLATGEACSVDLQVSAPAEQSWRISCAPIMGRKGKIHAVVAVFYDVTELERVDRMRKDFVINVSHELRTPLAAIQGYAETLLDGAIDEPGTNRRFMKILWQNAERLAQLTADLMTLSQIEVNTREFHFSPHLVNELLDQAADSIRTVAEKKDIRVEVEPAPAELRAPCDSGAIHQVLNNLLDNAAKYTPEGGLIRMGARQRGDRVEFFVSDTGIGIPPEHIPRLFERFYRVDKARSRELGGTGLGLAIVKHLVNAHQGSVRVESEAGLGSTFYFELPLKPSRKPAVANGRPVALS